MNRLTTYALIAVLSVIALKLLVWYLEPRLVFFPFSGVQETPRALGLDFRDLSIPTRDGERLNAWWLEPADARADVVFFHGNGGNLSNWLPIIAGMHVHKLAVVAVDYRGYGASTGRPSEQGIYRDADATLDFFWRELHRPPRPVVYWGRSLGTAAAAYAAQVRVPDALILESPFPDKASVIAGSPVFQFLNLFASSRFPTSEFLRSYSGPALVVHGDADATVDLRLGRRVFDALRGTKQLVIIHGADHNDLHEVDPARYWEGVDAFLRSISVPPHSPIGRR